jgi:hypothetical protein
MLLARLLLAALLAASLMPTRGVVNADAVAKRRAKAKAKASYVERHGTVMDSYGRVMRWGQEPTKIECEKKHKAWTCSVTKHKVRKYRTRAEERRMKVLRTAKQAELDRRSGSTSEADKKKTLHVKEQRARCGLFREWKTQYAADATSEKTAFFSWLVRNYNDFGELYKLGTNRRAVRKAKKLYRHIALETHADKIPEQCSSDSNLLSMMAEVLGKALTLKNCILEPHTCDENRGL